MDLIKCPFCGDSDFDLIGLKDHLLRHCMKFEETISPEEDRRRRQYPMKTDDPRSNTGIAHAILQVMGIDNVCRFSLCEVHRLDLVSAIARCRENGLAFTKDDINLLAYVKESELKEEWLAQHPHAPELNRVLKEIFAGCDKCKQDKITS